MRAPETAQSYMTSFALPLELRARLDALRAARAQREGGLPPPLRTIVLEALEMLVEHEGARRPGGDGQ
jgi:predicted DNA-binding protein